MGTSQVYRAYAAQCLDIARLSSNRRTQALMRKMAEVWHRLAEDEELHARKDASPHGTGSADAGASVPPRSAPGHPDPASLARRRNRD